MRLRRAFPGRRESPLRRPAEHRRCRVAREGERRRFIEAENVKIGMYTGQLLPEPGKGLGRLESGEAFFSRREAQDQQLVLLARHHVEVPPARAVRHDLLHQLGERHRRVEPGRVGRGDVVDDEGKEVVEIAHEWKIAGPG